VSDRSRPAAYGLVDGYDRERLARCLAARGLIVDPREIVAVEQGGSIVTFADGESVITLPRWIEEARDAS
jgi:hypothetical protein